MALQWVVLGFVAISEAMILFVLTMPGLDRLRKGMIKLSRSALQPLLTVVPFSLFLLMDMYWKYEVSPTCEGHACSTVEHLRHQRSLLKIQRNALLVLASLLFYWLIFHVTHLLVRLEQMNGQIKKLEDLD
ncbi:uncharacterized protein LOC131029362 [Cryptomeria japonica]|uniref:uncharacterized protein LOC131029362 n=1 Tax=Cryptomeria japonica TaxID=3369 RepID=UPI0027D9D783|nr:uncharacterized protein LOC131029362 [Cryptomeria japonica]